MKDEGTCAKALGQDQAWCVGGTAKGPMRLEQSGRGGKREVMQGLTGLVEDLGFYPRKVGALEGYRQRRVGLKSVFWNELLGAWKRRDTRPAMDDGTRPGGTEKKEEVGRLWVHSEDKTSIICHQIRCGRGPGGCCWEGSQLFCDIMEAGRMGGKWLRKPHLGSGQNPQAGHRSQEPTLWTHPSPQKPAEDPIQPSLDQTIYITRF